MRQDLRKGQSSVYLQYESGGGDTIGADQFEATLEGESVVIRFHLRPVDDNQRIDERHIQSETLNQVDISDEYIIEKLAQFLKQPYINAQEMRLQIVSQGKPLDYAVSLGAVGLRHLPLLVQRVTS